jgi:hypothetical protein
MKIEQFAAYLDKKWLIFKAYRNRRYGFAYWNGQKLSVNKALLSASPNFAESSRIGALFALLVSNHFKKPSLTLGKKKGEAA